MQNHYRTNIATKKAYRKSQYWDNPDKAREDAGRWYRENPEKARASRAAYHDKNAERISKRSRDHAAAQREQDPEGFKRKKAASTARRRANKRKVTTDPVNYADVLERDGAFCYLYQQPVVEGDIHIDHVIPLAVGGSHTLQNLRVTHATCNDSKGTKTPWEWWDRKNLPYPPNWSVVGLIPPD